MSNPLASQLIALGQQLSEERDAAHDLWTWLPSHKVAERFHGDYASNNCPSVKDVMVEAAMYIACLKDNTGRVDRVGHTQEEKEWFERCPCGESHEGVIK